MTRAAWLAAVFLVTGALAGKSKENRPDDVFQSNVDLMVSHSTFVSLIDALSKQTGLGFVVDGMPRVSPPPQAFRGTLTGALTFISNRFDVSWERGPGVTVLIRKRFNIDIERPQSNARELKEVASRMAGLLRTVPFDRDRIVPNPIQETARQLSPESVALLKQNASLPVKDLSPSLRNHIYQTVNRHTFRQSEIAWGALHSRVGGLERSYLSLEHHSFPNSFSPERVSKRNLVHTSIQGGSHRTLMSSRPIEFRNIRIDQHKALTGTHDDLRKEP